MWMDVIIHSHLIIKGGKHMETIGFLGKVDDDNIKTLEKRDVIILNKGKQLINTGLIFLQERLKDFDVVCDWEAGYEDGTIEFIIESDKIIDLVKLKNTIQGFSGQVKFLRFI